MVPIYKYSAETARYENELTDYRESKRWNIKCKEAIEEAIRTHFDGMHLARMKDQIELLSNSLEHDDHLREVFCQKQGMGRGSRTNPPFDAIAVGNEKGTAANLNRVFAAAIEALQILIDGAIADPELAL